MKEIKVKDILKLTNGNLIIGDEEWICENFSKDTRTIQNGDIYIGIKGEKFDGNKFWKEALNKGASGVIIQDVEISLIEKEKYSNKMIIKVENTLEALYKIAQYKRSLYNIPVIAITGSVGKTSTKDLISSVVQTQYKTLKTEGNNNNNIGLPFTILKLKDHEAMVIEMGMNHFGEISLLTNIAHPTISVITNIGTSHIGNLGSRENILKAKLEILEGMEKPKLVINNDNDLLHNWYEQNKNKLEIHTYGIENDSECLAKDIMPQENSSNFNVSIDGEDIKIKVPVGGNHFVYNALSGVVVGRLLGITNDNIQKGIAELELTKKRMEIRQLENGAILINDSYNASYESTKSSIEYLASHQGKRKIAALGDMFELGEYSEGLHKKVGMEVARNKIDVLLCVGNDAKYIIEGAKETNNNIKTQLLRNNEELLDKLRNELKAGDVLLVKASNATKFYEICQKL